MLRILLVVNADKERACELAESAKAYLDGRATVIDTVTCFDHDLSSADADLLMIFGGDGTVLNAVRRLGESSPLLLTVNLGRLGFLAEVPPGQVESMLERVLAGQYRLSERMLLEIKALSGAEVVWQRYALNEVALSPAHPKRMIRLCVSADDRRLTQLDGDGMLVSTPTGSTAYALSAGGPILSPEMRAMVLVPVCPHLLSNRPLVLGPSETLSVEASSSQHVMVTVDGMECGSLAHADRLEIRCSQRVVRLICGESMGRYDILRAKLGWGSERTSG